MKLFLRKSTYAVLVLFLLPCLVIGQANVTDNTGGADPDASTCLDPVTEDITIVFPSGGDGGNATVTLNMPVGTEYVCASVAQTAGVAIVETDCTDPAAPVFTISGLSAGGNVQFTVEVEAGCGSVAGANTIDVAVSDAGADDNTGMVTFEVLEATISVQTVHANETDLLVKPPSMGMVDITIVNGGLGDVDQFEFCIDEVDAGICTNSLSVGGSIITPSSTMGTQTCYIVTAADAGNFGGDGLLSNTETVTFTRNYEVCGCMDAGGTLTNNYTVQYGCNDEVCQTSANAPGNFELVFGAPDVTHSVSVSQRTNLCDNQIFEVTYTNNGVGDPAAAAACNLFAENSIGFVGVNTAAGGDHRDPDWTICEYQLPAGNVITSTPGQNTNSNGGTPYGPMAMADFSQFTADPDGPGGLDDLDGDGQFDDLPSGASVTFLVVAKYTCPADPDPTVGVCIDPDQSAPSLSRYGFRLSYEDQCQNEEIISNRVAGLFDANRIVGSITGYASPPTVADGECFTLFVEMDYRTNAGQFACTANSTGDGPRMDITFDLPPGVTVAGNGTYNGNPVAETSMGTTVTLSGDVTTPGGVSANNFGLDFKFACPSGPLMIPYELSMVCDEACGDCSTVSVTCGVIDVLALCPGVCDDGGLTPTSVDLNRTTLGYTDACAATQVNAMDLSAIQLKRLLPCDEFKVDLDATQINVAANNAYIEIIYPLAGGGRIFMPTGGTFDFTDVSTGMTTAGIALPAPTETDISGDHVILWDLSALLPGGMIDVNDEISICATFTVLDNPALPAVPVQLIPMVNTFTLLNGTPAPGEGDRITCGGVLLEAYPFRLDLLTQFDYAIDGGGCNTGNIVVNWEVLNGPSFDPFPGEVRPYVGVEEVIFDLTNSGVLLDPNNPIMTVVVRGPGADDSNYPYTQLIALDVATPSQIVFTNNSISELKFPDYSPFDNRLSLAIPIINTCAAEGGTMSAIINAFEHYQTLDTDCAAPLVVNDSDGDDGFIDFPDVLLTEQTGVQAGDEDVECFDLRILNSDGAFDSDHVFLEFLDATSGMSVVSATITSINGTAASTVLPLQGYIDGQWVELAELLPATEFIEVELCVEYTGCDPITLTVAQGFECADFPDPDPSVLNCDPTTVDLMLTPALAQIQGELLVQPPAVVDACTPLEYELRINSSDAGNIIDPNVLVNVPAGMTLMSAEIAYPYDASAGSPYAGPCEAAIPVTDPMTGDVTVNLSDHSMIDGDLPGLNNENPADAPLEDRQALVKFTFVTDCDFISGSSIPFLVGGAAPCGELTNVILSSTPIDINGISADIQANFTPVTDVELTCGTQTIDQDFSYVDTNADGMPYTTGAMDVVTITLPAGMVFVPGSYMPDDANAPTFAGVMTVAGQQVITLTVPAGVTVPDLGSILTGFTYDIEPDFAAACGQAGIIETSYQQTFPPISCATAPGGICPNPATAIIGSGTTNVSFDEIEIANLTIDTPAPPTLSGTFDLLTQDLPAGESITIEVFCSSDAAMTTPIGTAVINGPIAAGTADIPYSIGYVAGTCDPETGVVKISPTTVGGEAQCVCAEAVSIVDNLPVEWSYFKATADECLVTLEWGTVSELNNEYFEVEYSVDGKTFKVIDMLEGAGTTVEPQAYSYIHKAASEMNYYRLKQVDLDGKYTYSNISAIRQACNTPTDKLEAYPIPVSKSELLQVNYYNASDTEDMVLKILNIQGKILKTVQLKTMNNGWNTLDLNVSELSAGVYYLVNNLGDIQRLVIVE